MYGEWMDAIPLLVDGFPEHNISQLRKVEEYWKGQGDNDRAESVRNQINVELMKL